MADHEYGFQTRAIHAGHIPDQVAGARAVPIYQSTAFEERVASLEGGLGAVATANGLSAEYITFTSLVGSGESIVASANLYGGSIAQRASR